MSTSRIKWSDILYFPNAGILGGVLFLCLVISSALGFQVPQAITDLGRNYHDNDLFYGSIQKLLIIFVSVYFNRAIYQLFVNKFIKKMTQNVRSLCYDRWLMNYEIQTDKKDVADRYPQGEVIARIMNDTEALRELITSGTFGIFIDIFFVLANLIGFINLNKFTGYFISGVELVAATLLIYGSKYMRVVFMSVRKSRGEMSRTIANVVGGIRESYYTDHQNYASKKGEIAFDDFLVKQLKSNIWDASYFSLAESLYPILLALVVLIFPYSRITEAALIFAIVDLIQRSIRPVKDVAGKIANIQRSYTGLVRISEFLGDLEFSNKMPEVENGREHQFDKYKVKIPLFQYPMKNEENPFSLEDIEFEIHRGEVVGVVGMSGSGKSTLLNILASNIIPPQASISLIGGEETMEFPGNGAEDVVRYRQQVGLVSQDSHIFSESLRFNITMSHEECRGFDEFWHWIKGKIPYLKEWGIGPDDVLNPKMISLGQKQLLAAIRSCFLKKPVVLFDEISSGLDSELELALRKVIVVIQENSLTFVVAHRLETVIEADRILVMDDGKLIASGSHEQLQQSSEIYRKFLEELSQ